MTITNLPSQFSQTKALLKAQSRGIWNTFWHMGQKKRISTVLVTTAIMAIWIFINLTIIHLVQQNIQAPSELLQTTIIAFLSAIISFTIITSISFAIASAYFNRDIEWLFTTPVPIRAILAHRFLSQLTLGSIIGGFLLGGILLTACVFTNSLIFLPVILIGLIALLSMPVSLGLLITIVIIRLVPAKRSKLAVGLLIAGSGLFLLTFAYLSKGHKKGLPWAGAINHLSATWLSSIFSPVEWTSQLLIKTWHLQFAQSLFWLLLLVALASILVWTTLNISSKIFQESWSRVQYSQAKRIAEHTTFKKSHPVLAIWRKDWRNLRRDPSQIGQLILPLSLFAIYLLTPNLPGGSGSIFKGFPVWYGALATSLFATIFINSGIGLRAMGSEGKSFWCLKIAPLKYRTLFVGKMMLPFSTAIIPSLTLFLITDIRDKASLFIIEFSCILLVLSVLGLTMLAVGLGALWQRLDWDDPRRAIPIWAAWVYSISGTFYIGGCVVALTLPLLFLSKPLGTTTADLISIGCCGATAAIIGLPPLWLGYRRIATLDL